MLEDITNAELYRSLLRIERQLDTVTNDHEARLRRLERFMWGALGLSFAGASSGVTSFLWLVSGGS